MRIKISFERYFIMDVQRHRNFVCPVNTGFRLITYRHLYVYVYIFSKIK